MSKQADKKSPTTLKADTECKTEEQGSSEGTDHQLGADSSSSLMGELRLRPLI